MTLQQKLDTLCNAVGPLVEKYGYGPKSDRPDYLVSIPCSEFHTLTQAYRSVVYSTLPKQRTGKP